MGDVETGHVDVNGLKIAYRRAGSGPPLLMLHGGVSDGREWSRQMAALSDEMTTVAWDAPGHGGSDDPWEPFSLSDYADCVVGLVDALGLGRPHVMGLSFGGGLALEVFHRAPDLPRSLILVSGYAGWAGSLPPDEVAERLAWALRESERWMTEQVPADVPGLFTEPVNPALDRELTAIMAEVRPASLAVMGRAFAEADLRDVLPTVDVPTLVLHGELDQRAPRPVADALHAGIRGSRLVVVPGAGHMLTWEAAGAANDAVRTFVRSVDQDHREPAAGDRAEPRQHPG